MIIPEFLLNFIICILGQLIKECLISGQLTNYPQLLNQLLVKAGNDLTDYLFLSCLCLQRIYYIIIIFIYTFVNIRPFTGFDKRANNSNPNSIEQ